MTRERITRDEQGTLESGIELAGHLQFGDCIALEGMLGAGKTCLARGIAMGLGIAKHDVASPTFALIHEHACTMKVESGGEAAGRFYHLDAFRLAGTEDLESIGWEEVVDDPTGILVIEWASRIGGALPPSCIKVDLEYLGVTERGLYLSLPDDLEIRFGSVWNAAS